MSLKARLREDRLLLAPGVYDGLTALIAEQAGAEAVYLSGASVAYARYGRPDIGLVGMTEVADVIASQSVDAPVGTIRTDGHDVLLRVTEQRRSPDELERIVFYEGTFYRYSSFDGTVMSVEESASLSRLVNLPGASTYGV